MWRSGTDQSRAVPAKHLIMDARVEPEHDEGGERSEPVGGVKESSSHIRCHPHPVSQRIWQAKSCSTSLPARGRERQITVAVTFRPRPLWFDKLTMRARGEGVDEHRQPSTTHLVTLGLDPRVHEALQRVQRLCRITTGFSATSHHGCSSCPVEAPSPDPSDRPLPQGRGETRASLAEVPALCLPRAGGLVRDSAVIAAVQPFERPFEHSSQGVPSLPKVHRTFGSGVARPLLTLRVFVRCQGSTGALAWALPNRFSLPQAGGLIASSRRAGSG